MSTLLNRGRSLLRIWAVEKRMNDRGEVIWGVAKEPHTVRVTTSRPDTAVITGTLTGGSVRVLAQKLPPEVLIEGKLPTGAKLELDGDPVELDGPAIYTRGPSRGSSHWRLQVRSVNAGGGR